MNAFTFELARRLAGSGVTVNCLHPGVVATNIWPADAPLLARIIIGLMKPFMLSPRRGAAVSLYVATAPDVANVSGRYFVKSKPVDPSPVSRDPQTMAKIWEWTLNMTGISEGRAA